MGFAPWKLNNTGNQIDRLCCQDCFCQRISDIIRETANKHIDKQCELFFRWLEDGANTVYHGGYDDLKRFTKCDVRQFICKEEKEFSQCTVILISALLHCNHEEASRHNRYVCGQRIIRQAVAFCNQLQVGLTGLEKHLDLPAFLQIKAIQSFLFFLWRTQTIFAGIFCSFPTVTFTESRYLLRPRRFLQMPKIFLMESCFPS